MTVPDSRLFDPAEVRKALTSGLARVCGELPLSLPGPCSDCKREGPRRRYNTLELCSACTFSRLTAAKNFLPDVEYETLVARLKTAGPAG